MHGLRFNLPHDRHSYERVPWSSSYSQFSRSLQLSNDFPLSLYSFSCPHTHPGVGFDSAGPTRKIAGKIAGKIAAWNVGYIHPGEIGIKNFVINVVIYLVESFRSTRHGTLNKVYLKTMHTLWWCRRISGRTRDPS